MYNYNYIDFTSTLIQHSVFLLFLMACMWKLYLRKFTYNENSKVREMIT